MCPQILQYCISELAWCVSSSRHQCVPQLKKDMTEAASTNVSLTVKHLYNLSRFATTSLGTNNGGIARSDGIHNLEFHRTDW